MTSTRRTFLAAMAAVPLPFAPRGALAQRLPPGKIVHLVLPVAPGGTVDLLARQLARRMADVLGQPVVVDNKPGGSGAISGSFVASAAADGTTLLLGAMDLATLPAMLAQKNFVPLQQLAPVGLISDGRLVLVVNPDKTPVRTVAELVAQARANPGSLTFGSAGNGNVTHLFGEVFRRAAGIDMRHVAYRGTGPALTDLQGGQINMLMAGPASVRELVAAGRLRALAVTGKGPGNTAGLGDVPTFLELGMPMPETDLGAWQGLFVPRGTPRETILQLNQALNAVLAEPEMRAFLASVAAGPVGGTPEALGDLLDAQTRFWGQVIRQAGIAPG